MAGQPLQLQRTTYRDLNGQVRPGNPTCGESALDMEQYYQPLERFHASSLHGWGVAAGLRVAATLNGTGVTVLPGIALDSNGMHIFLISGQQAEISKDTPGVTPLVPVTDSGVVIPTASMTGDQYLVIQFWETFDSQAQDNGIFRYTHTPWLHFVDATHLTYDGSSIILAKVSFGSSTTGQIAALADMRQRADWHVERTHEASIHGAGVAAGLGVMVTLNSAGVTVLPGIALDGNGQYISLANGGQAETDPNAAAPGATPRLVPITDTGVVIPTTGLIGDKYLTIQFWETAASETLATTLQSVAPFHFVHTPWLRFQDVAGFVNDGTSIILAKVSFGTSANAGLVTDLALDQRQETSLAVGNISIQRGITTSPATNKKAINNDESGTIRAYTTGGLDITAPNATDEIHMERDDGHNVAKISLGAQAVVARRDNGTESVTIDTQSGSIASANLSADFSVRQNSLYMSGGIGWSSLTYNAHHNDANNQWVFPDTSHPAVTVEMDDNSGVPRFQVWSTTSGNHTGWMERFAINGNSGDVSTVGGNLSTGMITATGEIAVKNAQGTDTVILNANTATIEAGASGVSGSITAYDKSHAATCIINGDNGKINTKALYATGNVTAANSSGGGWALGGFATQGGVGLRAANGGIQAELGTSQYAGDFTGNVNISGSLHVSGPISKSGGGFKIDHPCDPQNKYLTHSFVESPDRKNIYDGIAILDANGEAIVELPEWFTALNRDVRYQLTCIGGYAPVCISQKIHGSSFKIAGGKPEMEVSWQVTGIRQDAWACAHPLSVEEMKQPEEQGHYLHPAENGADPAVHSHTLRHS
ncbi:hypothetical protein [Dictyobacter formicarum]|uniref:Uncharacterized protein n=1 Tax=Dictyobacter formicarum TaxID=2778368 RepID=A0ABQ3VAZ9_9CHLR|nr:hypothetical protein [Dictyobacter formicarum]GHO83204.1 hypothetical protein KSZ_12100 [Dictyobacter formicarum]